MHCLLLIIYVIMYVISFTINVLIIIIHIGKVIFIHQILPDYHFCWEIRICQCYSMNKPSARISQLIGR